jgi:hypothetical protein
MLRSALAFLFLILLLPAQAERYIMERYGATVNLPDGDGWFRRGGPGLSSGEFAVFALNSISKSHFGVAVAPGFPTNDVRHSTVLNKMMEIMRTFGIEPHRQRIGEHNDHPYIEIIGTTKLDSGESYVSVARGVLKNTYLYVVIHTKSGVDADADQIEFMNNIETLNFDATPQVLNFNIATTIPALLPWHYRAYRGGAAMAVLLMIAFVIMLIVTRTKKAH